MRTPEDLSGKDGQLVLVEFCEEHPPLTSQVNLVFVIFIKFLLKINLVS